mgnify:CR=1 FL=1|jgi:hypothetical protein|tara:strand:+ start:135 stop:1094 length:960 start_codon:yes stop_codon:yes gene_type:complete
MHRFLKNILIVSLFIIALHLILGALANGSTDNFYLRFTSSKQNSLIIGTSRSAQGIHPNILDSVLNLEENNGIYNYSFSINNSSYGKEYYYAIKNKINESAKNGLFIITVDPWAISSDTTLNDNEIDIESIFYSKKHYNSYPNYEYLIKNYKKGWGNILLKRIESNILIRNQNSLSKIKGAFTYLRKDGLLEVYTSMDSTYVKQNIQKKVYNYNTSMSSNKFSKFRFLYLRKTIQLLKKHGEVYLVRMPVHTSLFKIEDSFDPQFDKRIMNLANKTNVDYLNFADNATQYSYTDGNHLYINDAKIFSNQLAERIKILID